MATKIKKTSKNTAPKRNKKTECLGCIMAGWRTVHRSDCKRGAKETIARTVALLKELQPFVGISDDEEDDILDGETFESNPYDLQDLILNLAVLASAQAKRIGVKEIK